MSSTLRRHVITTPAIILLAIAGTHLAAPAVCQAAQPAPGERPSMPVVPNVSGPSKGGMPDPLKDAGKAPRADKPKVNVSDTMTVDLSVKDENISAVLEMLAVQSRKNIIASKNVSGKVSADLFGVTFYEALDAILNINGFGYREQGNFLYIYTAQELEAINKANKLRVAKVIRLNYLTAPDAAEFVKPMLSTGGEIKHNVKTENFQISENTPAGKDDFALGSTMVVVDYEENIKAIELLIAELDIKPAQVLVEATVLNARVQEDNAFGVDFSIIGDLRFQDFATAALGGPFGIVPALRQQPINVGRGGAVGSDVGGTGQAGGFKVGIVQDNVALFIRALDSVTNTTVLANPKILTLNRQSSRVLVGQRVGYLSTTATETSTTQTVQFLDTGVQLYFRPFVNAARNEVRMELKPQFSRATPTQVPGANGAQIIIPNEDTQEIVTNVIVPDGMTVVLGGLFREDVTSNRQQVPFVGDIPIIGAAFRGNNDTTTRSEIIFLVTPRIINDKSLVDHGERGLDLVERVRAGSRQGLLPFSTSRMTAALNMEAEQAARDGDIKRALWVLSRSLSIDPRQPDAMRLRERLTGQAEVWPSRSMFEDLIHQDVNSKIQSLPEGNGTQPHFVPNRSLDVPLVPTRGEVFRPHSAADTTANPHDPSAPAAQAAPAVAAGDETPGVAPATPTASAALAVPASANAGGATSPDQPGSLQPGFPLGSDPANAGQPVAQTPPAAPSKFAPGKPVLGGQKTQPTQSAGATPNN